MKLAPAILTNSTEELTRLAELAHGFSDRIQLDYIDGKFVDNKTVTLADMHAVHATIDLDVMAAEPSAFIADIVALKPSLAVCHIEVDEDLQPVFQKLRASGVRVGVALNASTDISRIEPLVPLVDHVLVMGYDAGFAGQAFQDACLAHIRSIKKAAPHVEVGVDGGVNEQTIPRIKEAGADIAYVNSAIFQTNDPHAAYEKLKELAS